MSCQVGCQMVASVARRHSMSSWGFPGGPCWVTVTTGLAARYRCLAGRVAAIRPASTTSPQFRVSGQFWSRVAVRRITHSCACLGSPSPSPSPSRVRRSENGDRAAKARREVWAADHVGRVNRMCAFRVFLCSSRRCLSHCPSTLKEAQLGNGAAKWVRTT